MSPRFIAVAIFVGVFFFTSTNALNDYCIPSYPGLNALCDDNPLGVEFNAPCDPLGCPAGFTCATIDDNNPDGPTCCQNCGLILQGTPQYTSAFLTYPYFSYYSEVGRYCIDFRQDDDNCGTCGKRCPSRYEKYTDAETGAPGEYQYDYACYDEECLDTCGLFAIPSTFDGEYPYDSILSTMFSSGRQSPLGVIFGQDISISSNRMQPIQTVPNMDYDPRWCDGCDRYSFGCAGDYSYAAQAIIDADVPLPPVPELMKGEEPYPYGLLKQIPWMNNKDADFFGSERFCDPDVTAANPYSVFKNPLAAGEPRCHNLEEYVSICFRHFYNGDRSLLDGTDYYFDADACDYMMQDGDSGPCVGPATSGMDVTGSPALPLFYQSTHDYLLTPHPDDRSVYGVFGTSGYPDHGDGQYILKYAGRFHSEFCGVWACDSQSKGDRDAEACCTSCETPAWPFDNLSNEIGGGPTTEQIEDWINKELFQNTCTDLYTDESHCGFCNNRCGDVGEGFLCVDGRCCETCSEHQDANLQCIDKDTDSLHCGQCGNECEAHIEHCIGGKCVPKCNSICEVCVSRFTEHGACQDFTQWSDKTPEWCLACCDACCDQDAKICEGGIEFFGVN